MKVRIDYHNGDWDVMEIEGTFQDLREALGKIHVQAYHGNIDGRQALIPASAIRCIQEWSDGN